MAASSEFPRFDLSGQVVLVTAAARGLGRACALACAHAGADIALGLRDKRSGEGLAAAIQKLGRKALPLQMDMTRLDEIEHAVAAADKHFGKIDVLVNNAGASPENLAENVNEADFDLTLQVNLKGTFFASQAAGS
jgi:NAD(P)-dependent dehydrogenase (short-subunit alcohol dehydrogenase family)